MTRPGLAAGSLAAFLALLTISLAYWGAARAATVTINTVDGFPNPYFLPENVTVSVGDTVSWANPGFGVHTTTSSTGLWSDDLFPGDTFSFTFTAPGIYEYICLFHDRSGMVGRVTVTDGSAAPTASPTAPQATLTATPVPTSTPVPSTTLTTPGACPLRAQGDANCDGRYTLSDYTVWRNQFLGTDANQTADFNGDGRMTLTDYTIWRNSFLAG